MGADEVLASERRTVSAVFSGRLSLAAQAHPNHLPPEDRTKSGGLVLARPLL
jgi:hypothetical protein